MKKTLALSMTLPVMAALQTPFFISAASAHGWSEFPPARQAVCYDQGGIWSGTPPSPGCAQAKAISGSFPFVQRNEYAKNINDYNNMQAVRSAIPDGTLCYANDDKKAGMGVAHSGWTRTEVKAGTFEFVFNATAPHNPSFWQFYLTKPNADLSKKLAWGDLELIQEVGNVPVVAGKYRMDVTIPESRSGNAILYTRWQRDDSAGEGFYNCSDIAIINDNNAPDPEPKQPYLVQGNAFIPQNISLDSAAVGKVVNYTVLNQNAERHASFSVAITDSNKDDWDRLLASEVNGWYEANYNGDVFIGRWHDEMSHYMYFRNDLHGNYFNSRDAGFSGQFSITDAIALQAVITPKVLKPLENASVVHGDYVVLTPSDSNGHQADAQWQQTSGTTVQTTTDANQQLLIDTSTLPNARHELTFQLALSSNSVSDDEVYSFVVQPSGSNDSGGDDSGGSDDSGVASWSAAKAYAQGDVVSHAGKTWTAQWWTQGEEPGTTGDWGAWR
ncbi:lytic polysaccharide monooxygenase [Endozoicomonas euniceicola]|uniref:lytic polysaccharide monooxygenase n=1 Tax=Endozoicomonas euniceicola TaxID=1234143 RepID=UPI00298CFE91|nr:lytic polysaccharide monooxygenase [Endozoicomonas euniceicola]